MHALRSSIVFRLGVLACFLVVRTLCAQQPPKLGDLKTVDGHEYRDVTVTEKTTDGIAITHDSGVARLRWNEVSAETQRLLGYNAAADAAAKQRVAGEAAAMHAKVKQAAVRLSRQQLKSMLTRVSAHPAENKAWKLTFTDPWTVAISFTYTTPAMWYPMGGIALTRENQLRDVLAAKFIQDRGGRGFTDEEVAFLDFNTRIGLERHPGRQKTLQVRFPATHAPTVSQQIARYWSALGQASAEPYDFGAVGANTFGYNKDKTMRVNDTSLPSSEVSAFDALVARVPQLQQQLFETILHQ